MTDNSTITFPTASREPRPVRLPEATRRFAFESLRARYGRETEQTPFFEAEGAIPGFAGLDDLDRHDAMIRLIAEQAPIRIVPGERLSGAATIGDAMEHWIPVRFRSERVFYGVSHLTADFETPVLQGLRAVREEAEEALARHEGDPMRVRFIRSCLATLDSFETWRRRYVAALREMPGMEANTELLEHVPWEPARTYREGLQSIWFCFAFLRLCGNWPGIGRIDHLLGPLLAADLAAGRTTLDEARDDTAHFFVKGCEWICGRSVLPGSGDAQHYQNLVLTGVDEDGREVENEVTHLVLDVVEELGIGDFPISVRVGAGTSERLLRRCGEVVRHGGGILAFYGERTVLRALERRGLSPRDARSFANDGCWEVTMPGRTHFIYHPFDALAVLQQKTLRGYAPDVSFDSFEALFSTFAADLRETVRDVCVSSRRNDFEPDNPFAFAPHRPCTAISLFVRGCVARGRSYLEGGPDFLVYSPHIGGYPDVVDSLWALKRLVFDADGSRVPLAEMLAALRANWEGHEDLRRRALALPGYWGNDDDGCDTLAAHVLHEFALACQACEGMCGFHFPPGVSTFGRQIEWAPNRLASPHGRLAGDILAANCTPTPGTDRLGATAVIRSYCKADLSEIPVGAALDLKLFPRDLEGEDGLAGFATLLRGFEALGGFFVQPDLADAALLRRAQEHPEEYPALSVRVSGWNARFATLSRPWQEMVINARS